MFTVVLGDCAAFGGRCPSTPEPLVSNDVFGGTAIGVFIGVFSIGVAISPHSRGVVYAIAAAAAAGVAAGWWAVAAIGTL